MSGIPSRWLQWTGIAIVALALAAYVAMQLLYPTHATPEKLAEQMKLQAALTGPAKVYAATCAHCHEVGDGARIAPVLAGRALPAEAVKVIVRHGLRGMPAFLPTHINDAELDGLATYVSQLPADNATSK